MALNRWRLGVTGMLVLVAVASWAIGQPAKPTDEGKEKSAVRTYDSLKNLPPGTILVVTENLKDAQQLGPNLILLTQKQYDDLLHEIAQLKAKIQTERATPGECHLKGAVVGDLVRLHADFKFVTEKDSEQVLLGFRSAQPTGATLDGSLPLFRSTKDGLVMHVAKKGEHSARLDMEVNLSPTGDRGRERGFGLDLPGAAVTSLELDLPAGIKEVAVGFTTPARSSSRLVGTREEGDKRRLVQQLGAATGLEISWKGPLPASTAPPLLTAQGVIIVRVFEQQVVTEAELTLKPRGKPINLWRLRVPPHATVTVKPRGNDERPVADVEEPNGPADQVRLVRLKEPRTETLQLTVRVEHKREQGAMAVGPFAVEGAAQQRGDILLSAPADNRLRVFPRGTVGPRELTADEQRQDFKAAFSYWSVPAGEPPGQPYPPLLEVDAESSRGAIEARVSHTLQKTEENWKLTTVIDATPLTTGVDLISVQLPADYQLTKGTPPRQGEPRYEVKSVPGGARVAEIKLAQKQSRSFQVTLEGTYPRTDEPNRQVTLELPQPQQTVAPKGGSHQVTIFVPETLELEAPKGDDPGWEVTRSRHYRQVRTTDRLPMRIEIAWQPHRQELLLASVADIAISGRMALVVQQFWFAAAQAPAEVQLRVPETAGDVQVLERNDWNAASRTVTLPKDVSEKRPLRLRYTFPIQAEGPTAVPLAVPAREARCETKVRITCEPGTLAERAGGPWEELPLEPTADGMRLASLVLHGDRPETPPILRLSESLFTPLASLVIEKTLIRVWVTDQGQQTYHASFLVTRAGRTLDIEFPAPPSSLNVKVALGGLAVSWGPVEENAPKPAGNVDPSRVARVPLGVGVTKPTLVDVRFQTSPGQLSGRGPAWTRTLGPLQSLLQPPRPCGNARLMEVRWQIVFPPEWMPLHEDGTAVPEQTWDWRGWLLASRPSASEADLKRWIGESEENATEEGGAPAYPSLTSRRSDLDPLQVMHVPQQVWLLGCSLVLLLMGLGLYFLRPGRLVLWLVACLLGGSAITISLLWPGALSTIVYGCEPGLLALLVVIAMQWLLQQRYRRQVVFLPSFKRVKPSGSSLIHKSGTRPPREPSTVDVVPPAPSSQWAKGSSSGPGNGG